MRATAPVQHPCCALFYTENTVLVTFQGGLGVAAETQFFSTTLN